jgi:hypothetical protein
MIKQHHLLSKVLSERIPSLCATHGNVQISNRISVAPISHVNVKRALTIEQIGNLFMDGFGDLEDSGRDRSTVPLDYLELDADISSDGSQLVALKNSICLVTGGPHKEGNYN